MFRFHPQGGDKLSWLRYRHIPRGFSKDSPQLITDTLGYNSGDGSASSSSNCVGDLILDCEVTIDRPEGELVLELCKGEEKFHAVWDLASGACTLKRIGKQTDPLDTKPSKLGKGTYRLRFANVDQRLTVWVNNSLIFGEGVPYKALDNHTNWQDGQGDRSLDKKPAAIAVRGTELSVQHLQLWRDNYYRTDAAPSSHVAKLLYVQPGHYLCLGDNSASSADSRSWGLVPEHLLFGKAVLIWWPPSRMGLVH